MHIIVTEKNQINHSISYETAAWYKNLTAVPGDYELKRLEVKGKVSYVVKFTGEIVSDNFQSLFAGNAFGERYDQNQNTGKTEDFTQSFNPSSLFSQELFAPTEEGYEILLLDAKKELEDKISLLLRCLNDSTPQWMSGHAKELAECTELYSKVHGVLARRNYNTKNGGKGWGEKDLKIN